MAKSVAIVGAGVSGLTAGIVFAEAGYDIAIFAEETEQQTTSAAAGAIWFPYDAEPADKVIPWALQTYRVLTEIAGSTPKVNHGNPKLDGPRPSSSASGVSMIELRQFARDREIEIPEWARSLGGSAVGEADSFPHKSTVFRSGFSLRVPLTDTTIYLAYLRNRLTTAGGKIHGGVHLDGLEDVAPEFKLVINCAGFGAKQLTRDPDLEPHRGQIAIVPKIDGLKCAIVCDDAPLMYAIPRANDCVFGGTNEISDDRTIHPETTSRIVSECCRVLNIDRPKILNEKVGLRPFRKSGVRLERDKLSDGRTVIHNYGHGGAGFTLSWGCAQEALRLA